MKIKIPKDTLTTIDKMLKFHEYQEILELIEKLEGGVEKYEDTALLYFSVQKYLSLPTEEASHERITGSSSLEEFLAPIYTVKNYLQRIEFIDDKESIAALLGVMLESHMSIQELILMIDMFCIEKERVFAMIRGR